MDYLRDLLFPSGDIVDEMKRKYSSALFSRARGLDVGSWRKVCLANTDWWRVCPVYDESFWVGIYSTLKENFRNDDFGYFLFLYKKNYYPQNHLYSARKLVEMFYLENIPTERLTDELVEMWFQDFRYRSDIFLYIPPNQMTSRMHCLNASLNRPAIENWFFKWFKVGEMKEGSLHGYVDTYKLPNGIPRATFILTLKPYLK